jgi:hypothetical protein
VATTYTFDAAFFETECLGRFVGIESDPVEDGPVYLVEREERLAQVFSAVLVDDAHVPRARSLRWHLLPVRVPRGGVFHAKVSLLAWDQRVRVIVSSANLSEPGYRTNYENAAVLDFGPDSALPGELLNSVLDFLEGCRRFSSQNTGGKDAGPQPALAAFLNRVRETATGWPGRERPRGSESASFLPVLPGGPALFDQVRDQLWWGAGPSMARIVSPFFNTGDGSRHLVDRLVGVMGVQGERHLHFITSGHRLPDSIVELDLPSALQKPWGRRRRHSFSLVTEATSEGEVRPLHAKSLWLQGGDQAVYVVGSSNFTMSGMGIGPGPVNIEANVAYSLPDIRRPFARKTEQTYPPYEPLDASQLDLRFVQEVEETTADPEAYTPLPAEFGEALFEPDQGGGRLLLHVSGAPPSFEVMAEGTPIMSRVSWENAGGPCPEEIEWTESRPPSALEVRWENRDGESHVSLWPVNATDTSRLPPPSELRDLPLEVLLEILTSASPLHIVYQRLRRREDRAAGDGWEGIDIDPHKKVDTRNFLVRRVRRVSRALEGLRVRLERPAFHLDALQWRLHGPVGPLQLARRLAEEEDEGAAFMIAEVALTVARADWTATEQRIGAPEVRHEVASVMAELRDLALQHPAPDNLSRYVRHSLAQVAT